MGGSIKKKSKQKTTPNPFCYLAEGQIISEAQELVHSNKGDRKGYSEEEYEDLEW